MTIADLRKRAGKSLKVCADGIGITVSTLRRREQGKSHPSIENAIRICQFYEVSIDCIDW